MLLTTFIAAQVGAGLYSGQSSGIFWRRARGTGLEFVCPGIGFWL